MHPQAGICRAPNHHKKRCSDSCPAKAPIWYAPDSLDQRLTIDQVIAQKTSDQQDTLPTDHFTMTKTSSPDEQGYRTMTKILKALQDGAQDHVTRQWESEVIHLEEEFGPDHTLTLDAKHGLAERWAQKKESHSKATELTKKVVSGNETQRGGDHPATLLAIRDSGLRVLEWGTRAGDRTERFRNASFILQPLLSRFEKVFGEKHEATIRLLDTLGHVRNTLDEYDRAEAMLARAAIAKLDVFGPASLVFARAVYYLSGVQLLAKYYQAAEANLKRAVDVFMRELGPDATWTILAWDMLGTVYMTQKRPIDAENVFVDLLDILEKSWGLEHLDTLLCCHNLSLAYMMRKPMLAKAEAMNRRAVEGLSKRPGPPDSCLLHAMSTTAGIQQERGFYKEAEKSYKKLVPLCEEHMGPQSPLTLQVIGCFADLYRRQGKMKKAQALQERAGGGSVSFQPPPSVW